MNQLWDILATLAVDLSPPRVESAATAIELIDGPTSASKVRSSFGPNVPEITWQMFVLAWQANKHVSSAAVATALRVGNRVRQIKEANESVKLVWTGPVGLVPVRSTEQVMLELLRNATESIFLVSYVNVGAQEIIKAINEAIERGVHVQMILESEKKAAKKMSNAVPEANIYVWSKEAKREFAGRSDISVHAKCVVSDRTETLITSANLTDHALERNMELGVHIKGGRNPGLLLDHLKTLVSTDQVALFDG